MSYDGDEDADSETFELWVGRRSESWQHDKFVDHSSEFMTVPVAGTNVMLYQDTTLLLGKGVTGSSVWDSSVVLAKYLEHWNGGIRQDDNASANVKKSVKKNRGKKGKGKASVQGLSAVVRGDGECDPQSDQVTASLQDGVPTDAHSLNLANKRVVEVGAGCGLVGIAASLLGASEVVCTDQEHMIKLLEKNLKKNNVHRSGGGVSTAVCLHWGDDPVRCGLSPPYDVILGADCVFAEEAVEPLLDTIAALSGPSTIAVLTGELRNPEVHSHFVGQMQKRFNYKEIPLGMFPEEWRNDCVVSYSLQGTRGEG